MAVIDAGNRTDTGLGFERNVEDDGLAIVDNKWVTKDDELAIRNNKLAIDNDKSAAGIGKKIDVDDRSDI